MSSKNFKKGFTLVELLIAISIVAILIAISVFGVQGARESSRDAKRKADLETIRSGLEFYRADCNIYPVPSGSNQVTSPLVGVPPPVGCSASNSYIPLVPTDPLSSTNRIYRYVRSTTTSYQLWAYLEGTSTPASNCPLPAPSCGSGNCNYCVTN